MMFVNRKILSEMKISEDTIAEILSTFGIDPKPELVWEAKKYLTSN